MSATLSKQAVQRKHWTWAAVTLGLVLASSLPARADTRSTGTAAPPRPVRQVIVASHPLASEAGLAMLRRGGSAIDAAIAAQLVMGLVEPQSSGIGGGLFILRYGSKNRRIETYDGRETAPASVTPNLFVGTDGKPQGFIEAAVGGKSVGVPGAIATLWLAHRDHGRLPWRDLFEPAISLAENGFPASQRLARLTASQSTLSLIPETAAYFRPGGKPLEPGQVVRNPDYARTLRDIAADGPRAFYRGRIAQAIVDRVAGAQRNATALTLADLAAYQPRKRAAVCSRYRGYRICGMAPPSSGGVATQQILRMLERFNLASLGPSSPQAMHLFVEAQRLAFADRGAFLADPGFVPVPVKGLLSPVYLARRGRLISLAGALAQDAVRPGNPRGASRVYRRLHIPDNARPSTAHLSVIDAAGNAVAMTTTVEGPFGSHLMAAGFILNNQLTDFAFEPAADNRRLANAPDAGKRPLSSMSPTLVFDPRGRLFAVIGSPGGWRIIPYVSKTIIGLVDWKLPMAEAIALPNVTSRSALVEIEDMQGSATLATALEALGHQTKLMDQVSGLNGIRITRDGFDAAADPRREGSAAGD